MLGVFAYPCITHHLTGNITGICGIAEAVDCFVNSTGTNIRFSAAQQEIRISVDRIDLVWSDCLLFTVTAIVIERLISCIPFPCICNFLTEFRVIWSDFICSQIFCYVYFIGSLKVVIIILYLASSCNKIISFFVSFNSFSDTVTCPIGTSIRNLSNTISSKSISMHFEVVL